MLFGSQLFLNKTIKYAVFENGVVDLEADRVLELQVGLVLVDVHDLLGYLLFLLRLLLSLGLVVLFELIFGNIHQVRYVMGGLCVLRRLPQTEPELILLLPYSSCLRCLLLLFKLS